MQGKGGREQRRGADKPLKDAIGRSLPQAARYKKPTSCSVHQYTKCITPLGASSQKAADGAKLLTA